MVNKNTNDPGLRDPRIDFFRGVILVIVLINHIEEFNGMSLLSRFTPKALGFSDCSEAFVFLSGYTFGLVYDRRILESGFVQSFKRATKRSLQIYAYYLVLVAVLLAIGFVFQSHSLLLGKNLSLHLPVSSQVLCAIFFSNHPYGLAILGFFFLMLPFATALTWLSQKNWLLACCASASLYVYVQLHPETNLPSIIPSRPWFFNPFAWQFLYFAGITMGRTKLNECQVRRFNRLMIFLCCVFLPAGLIFRQFPGFWQESVAGNFRSYFAYTQIEMSKTTLGPIRFLHFLCLAWLLSRIVSISFASHRFHGWIRKLGCNSLFLYGLGVVLLFCSAAIFSFTGKSIEITLIVEVILLSIAVSVTLAKSSG